MLLPCYFSHLSCFSLSQHPSSSDITAPDDTSHEPGAAEDDRMASSHSDSDSSSRTSHDEDSDQGDTEGLNAYSDNESGSEPILDNRMTNTRATDVTEELTMTDTPGKCKTPGAFGTLDNGIVDPPDFDHGPYPDLEQTGQARTGTSDSEVLANGMSTHFTVTESSPAAGLSEPNSQGAAHKRSPHTSDKGCGRSSRMYLWTSCGKRAEKQQQCCRVRVSGV